MSVVPSLGAGGRHHVPAEPGCGLYKRWGAVVTGVALSVLSASHAFAQAPGGSKSAPITQEKNPNDDNAGGDEGRMNESYQAKGVEVGSFLFFPQIELETIHNSNVFARQDDEKSDMLWRIIPEVKFRSRFVRHELNIAAKAEKYLYKKYTSDDRTDLNGALDGRLDIQRNWEATVLAEAYKRAEDRGSPDDVGGVKPTPTYGLSTDLGTRLEQGRFVFAARAGFDRRTFDNVATSLGSIINNHDRDRWEYVGNFRTEYAVYDVVSVVGVVELNKRQYDDRRDDAGLQRSNDGYRMEGGISLDISNVIKGDFTMGYFEQSYDDPTLKSPSGLGFRARFNWTPSRMTVVVPSLEREVDETIVSKVSSLVRTSGGLLVRHELQRNVILTASGNVRREKYEGADGRAWVYEARARGTYAFTPQFYVGGEVGYRDRDSNRVSDSYQQWTLMARVGARI